MSSSSLLSSWCYTAHSSLLLRDLAVTIFIIAHTSTRHCWMDKCIIITLEIIIFSTTEQKSNIFMDRNVAFSEVYQQRRALGLILQGVAWTKTATVCFEFLSAHLWTTLWPLDENFAVVRSSSSSLILYAQKCRNSSSIYWEAHCVLSWGGWRKMASSKDNDVWTHN